MSVLNWGQVAANGTLQLFGVPVPLVGDAAVGGGGHDRQVTVTVPLPPATTWPTGMKGLVLGGLNVAGHGRFRVACNLTAPAATTLDCTVSPSIPGT